MTNTAAPAAPPALVFLPKQYWPPRKFVLAEWNPREMGEEEYEELVRGIRHFGLLGGLDVREEDSLLIGGHQRHRACVECIDAILASDMSQAEKDAELERLNLPNGEIPANPIRGLTDAQAAQLNVRLNNAEAQGRWNVPKLTEILSELDARGHDATLTGFDEDQVREMVHDADEQRRQDEDEDEIEMPEEPISRPGELYLLGKHRVLCGDATDPESWSRLLEGEHADMLFTDPPYGVAYVGGTKKKLTIKNDDLTEKLRELLARSLSLAWVHTKPGGTWYVCAPGGPLFTVFGMVLLALGTWRQTIQWVKDRFVLSRSDYHNRNEPIFAGDRPDLQDPDVAPGDELQVVLAESIAYGWKEGFAHRRLEDRTQDNVWEIPRPTRNEEHPTMKPLELVRRAIRNGTRPRQRVVDCFAGSGQTLLASDQLGRIAYVMELDPRYVDVIRRRYAERTGQLHLAPENAKGAPAPRQDAPATEAA